MIIRSIIVVFLIGLIAGCDGMLQGEITPEPPCNGEDRTACTRKKILNWRLQVKTQQGDRTYELYEAACDANDADGCWLYGRILAGPNSMTDTMERLGAYLAERNDSIESALALQKSCALGSIFGCLWDAENRAIKADWSLGNLPDEGQKSLMDDFYRACEANFLTGCWYYTDLSFVVDFTHDHPLFGDMAAKERFAAHKACEADDPRSCYILGASISIEAETQEQRDEAMTLWSKSCEFGYADGCAIYADIALGKDENEVAWALDTACKHGFDPSQWATENKFSSCEERTSGDSQ